MSTSTSTRPRLNWRLITKVLRYIKNHPDRYDQNTWLEYDGRTHYSPKHDAYVPSDSPTMCNTTGCFAGWCVMLSSTTKEWRQVVKDVAMDLGNEPDWVDETARRCGFTAEEADYLTDGADGSAKQQYETVRNRICAIARSRRTGEDFGSAEAWIEEHGRGRGAL